jgi:hypothetical protein
VHAGPDLDPERLRSLDRRLGAPHGTRWTIECGDKPVAGRVDLGSAVSAKQASNSSMVSMRELAPLPVAELGGLLGRGDDIGEQHRGKHAMGFGPRPLDPCEVVDRIHDFTSISDPRLAALSGEPNEGGAGDQARDVRILVGILPLPGQDERRHADGRKDVPDVEVVENVP